MTNKFIKPLVVGLTIGVSCSAVAGAGNWNAKSDSSDAGTGSAASGGLDASLSGQLFVTSSNNGTGWTKNTVDFNNLVYSVGSDFGDNWSGALVLNFTDAAVGVRELSVDYSIDNTELSFGKLDWASGAMGTDVADSKFSGLTLTPITAMTHFNQDMLKATYATDHFSLTAATYAKPNVTGDFDQYVLQANASTETQGYGLAASFSTYSANPYMTAGKAGEDESIDKVSLNAVPSALCTATGSDCTANLYSVTISKSTGNGDVSLGYQKLTSNSVATYTAAGGGPAISAAQAAGKLDQQRLTLGFDLSTLLKRDGTALEVSHETSKIAISDFAKGQTIVGITSPLTDSAALFMNYAKTDNWGTTANAQAYQMGVSFSFDK